MISIKQICSVVLLMVSVSLMGQDYLPKANVVNLKGETLDISQYVKTGGPKIVSLWATWCGPCRMELNALKEVAPHWKSTYGVEIITISVDIPQMVGRAKKMFETNGWTYTFLHDADQQLMSQLGIQGIPYSMLLDDTGKIISVQMGYSPNYEQQLEAKIKTLKKKPTTTGE
jgi:cytochrome c biogenesis protein CcmG, thiol:disulfide interchange protein DsbE